MNQNLELVVQDQGKMMGEGAEEVCTTPPPRDEVFSFVFAFKVSLFLTSQLCHSLVVNLLLRKIFHL